MFPSLRTSRLRHRATATLAVMALLLAGCTDSPDEAPADPVVVGAWPSIEPRLLSSTIAALLAAEGIPVDVREFGDASAARQAIELGEVDIVPGYSGAAWLDVLGRSDPPGDIRTSFARVREFDERQGLIWLRPRFESGRGDVPPVNATFAFFVSGPPSLDATIETMSQLASRLSENPDAKLCMDEDFSRRSDGRDAVYRAYGISLDRLDFTASPRVAVDAVVSGECLAGLSTTTDGRAWLAGLAPLDDDLQVFPAFVVAIVARQSVLSQQGVTAALGPFSSQLTSALLARHNGRSLSGPGAGIDVDAQEVEGPAQDLAALLRQRAGLAPRQAPAEQP